MTLHLEKGTSAARPESRTGAPGFGATERAGRRRRSNRRPLTTTCAPGRARGLGLMSGDTM